jgi:hypothetical protein
MHRIARQVAAALAVAAASSASFATPTYGDIAFPPGVYFGSGNVNGNWTIDTTNGVEVALRVKNRATLATIDGSSGVYHADSGLCNPVCSGGPKAMWNYELSVNTQAGGGSLVLRDVFVRLYLDIDPTAATNFVVLDVLNNWPDAEYWDGTTQTDKRLPDLNDFAVQQSANPLFGDSGFGFAPGAGLYDLRLGVFDSLTLQELASVATAVAIPEPASLALVGIALAAAGATARRRKAAA